MSSDEPDHWVVKLNQHVATWFNVSCLLPMYILPCCCSLAGTQHAETTSSQYWARHWHWINVETTVFQSYIYLMDEVFAEPITLCMLGKNFSRRHFEIFYFFLENRIWHFMQIVSYAYNFHEVSDPYQFFKKISSVCRLLNLPIAWQVLKSSLWEKSFKIFILSQKH